ncbi:MAG: ATP-dependent helicase [Anaerolineales bacterium]|nr:ATP-dependent helicase [Anaerolineales bacterium]
MSEYLKRVSDIKQDFDQCAAFDRLGSQVIIAGPGSGKTFLLTTKVAKTLFEGIVSYPHKVACITFSRQLAAKMEKEFRVLGIHDAERVYVGTVHSFCIAEIVMPAARLLPSAEVPRPFRIASQHEIMNALSLALQKQNVALPNTQRDQKNVKSNLEKFRRLHFAPNNDDFSSVYLPEADGYSRANLMQLNWKKLAHDYHHHLLHNSPPGVDFVYVEMLALKILHRFPTLALTLSAKYPWWFVDEYQDLSPLFHRMVTHLVESGPISVFAIGDPNQCIYEELHGSKPDYLTELADLVARISGNHLITLRTNYRSAQNIINLGDVILGKNTGYQSKLPDRGECYAVELANYPLRDTIQRILKRITSHTSASPRQSIAVLVGTRSQLSEMLKDLENSSDWKIRADKDPDFDANLELVEWVQSIARWCVGGTYFHELLPFWSSLYQAVNGMHTTRHQMERELFDALWDIRDSNCSLPQWLNQITCNLLDQTILDAYAQIRPDDVEEFQQLRDSASSKARLRQKPVRWLGLQDNDVFLTTFHSSKGLEFDAVIVVDLDGIFDSQSVPGLKSRVAYVAVTRAKTDLFILIPRSRSVFADRLISLPKSLLSYWGYDQSGTLRRMK